LKLTAAGKLNMGAEVYGEDAYRSCSCTISDLACQ